MARSQQSAGADGSVYAGTRATRTRRLPDARKPSCQACLANITSEGCSGSGDHHATIHAGREPIRTAG